MASWECVSEEFVRKSLIASPFMNLVLHLAMGVARGIVGVLEGLGRFTVGFDVSDRFYRKIHCLTSEFQVKFHAKNRYRDECDIGFSSEI